MDHVDMDLEPLDLDMMERSKSREGVLHPALSALAFTDLSKLYTGSGQPAFTQSTQSSTQSATQSEQPAQSPQPVTSQASTAAVPDDSDRCDEKSDGASAAKRERRKRRVKPPDSAMRDMVCGVCGDRAHGYNFNAVTCESCKAFFRRNALRAEMQGLKCNFDGNCKLDPHTRRFCTECRLRKCFMIGMKKDWILSEDQLQKRRERSRVKKELSKLSLAQCQPQSFNSLAQQNYSSCNTSFSSGHDSAGESVTATSPQSFDQPSPSPECVKLECQSPEPQEEPQESPSSSDRLTVEEDQICARLEAIEQALNDTVDTPYNEAQAAKFSPSSASGMFNMADTFIRRFIKFCKCLPEFAELSQEDQISLLKGGIMEVMILRGALKFDSHSMAFRYKKRMEGLAGDDCPSPAKDGAISSDLIQQNLPEDIASRLPDNVRQALAGKSQTELMEMAKKAGFEGLVNMRRDSADSESSQGGQHIAIQFFISLNQLVCGQKMPVLILMLIELFSPDRPNLNAKERVAKIQEYYSHVLYIFLRRFMPDELEAGIFPKLLMKLVDVRELGEASSSAASKLNVSAFEPLLVEVFGLR